MRRILIFVLMYSFLKVEAQTSAFKSIDSLVQIGRYKKALFTLEKMPSSFEVYKKTASIYNAVDNYKKASEFYEKALHLKNDYRTKIQLGKSYKQEQKREKAIRVFEEIAQQDSENLVVVYELGKLYLATKKGKKAVAIFKKLIESDPQNANYSYKLGLAYAQLKKRNLKINNYLYAYRKDNEHLKAVHKLALAFTMLRDKDSASIFIEKGLNLNPNHIDLNKLKINNLYREKKYNKAIELLNRIDSLEKNDHYTQKMLGKSYYNVKEYEKAKIHFNRAKILDREDFKAYTYLAHISLEEKKLKEAMLNYSIATYVGKKKRDKEHLGLAKVYYEMKLPKRVLEQYKKAVEENGKNAEALYLYAKFSDNYYKDKKTGYKLYKKYLNRFEGKDTKIDEFVKSRIKTIKKEQFLKGIVLE